MYIIRAKCNCPMCFKEEEVWYYKSKVEPIPVIECSKCGHAYHASNFTTNLLELRKDINVSATELAAELKMFLPISNSSCNITV